MARPRSRNQPQNRGTAVQNVPSGPVAPVTSAATPATLTTDRPDVLHLIAEIERLRESRVIAYFLTDTAQLSFDAMPSLYQQLRQVGKQGRIDLWIHSHGGLTEVPWRIVQLIRGFCDDFGVLVTSVAQSAATHVALGANEIVMGPYSLLSPVDPTRRHPLLPLSPSDPNGQPVPVSVQDLKYAVAFVKREAGEAGITGDGYAQIIAALFDKVHPLALGAIEQSYELTKLITRRLLSTHMDEETEGEEISRIADTLCDDYYSHQFPIGLMEARRLNLAVKEADEELYEAMWALLTYYQNIDRGPQPISGNVRVAGLPAGTATHLRLIGNIDSTNLRVDCQTLVNAQGISGQPAVSKWVELQP